MLQLKLDMLYILIISMRRRMYMCKEIIKAFEKFAEGYKKRRLDEIDDFMALFSDAADAQMIGIGATVPGAYEWFTGKNEIKEIILSDWNYWGNVVFDIENMRLTTKGDVAWFSLCAELEQVEQKEETLAFFANKMKKMLGDENISAHDKIFEAAHFGVRRVRECNLGAGYMWKMVITGVLVKKDIWQFHTLHWAMPVD